MNPSGHPQAGHRGWRPGSGPVRVDSVPPPQPPSPPAHHPALAFEPAVDGKRVVFHMGTRRYFRLGEREAGFLTALDGRQPVAALRGAAPGGFTPDQVDRLLAWLSAQGLLAEAGEAGPAAATSAVASGASLGPWGPRLRALWRGPRRGRLPLFSPDAWLDRHRRVVDALFSPLALLAYLLLLVLPVALPVPSAMLVQLHQQPLGAGDWALVYAGLLASVAVHEAAHALACKHFGGRVHSLGLMLLYLQPVAYCDVSDCWRMADRGHKVAVAIAGCFANLLLAALAWAGFAASHAPAVLALALVNLFLAGWNLIPFVRLDGYWIAVHLLDEPQLREKAWRAVFHRLRPQVLPAWPSATVSPAGLLAFGLASAACGALFWALGLWGVHRLLSWAAPPALAPWAPWATAALAAWMLLQGLRWAHGQWSRPVAPQAQAQTLTPPQSS